MGLYCKSALPFLLLVTVFWVNAQETFTEVNSKQKAENCFLRCIALCLKENSALGALFFNVPLTWEPIGKWALMPVSQLNTCKSQCQPFKDENLCSDDNCWLQCQNLTAPEGLIPETPREVGVDFDGVPPNPMLALLEWNPVPNAMFYRVMIVEEDGSFPEPVFEITLDNSLLYPKPVLCLRYAFQVAAVSEFGVSGWSARKVLPKPIPFTDVPTVEQLRFHSFSYERTPLTIGNTRQILDPGTIFMHFNFTPPTYWSSRDLVQLYTQVLLLKCGKSFKRGRPVSYPILQEIDFDKKTVVFAAEGKTANYNCHYSIWIDYYQSKCGTRFRNKASHPQNFVTPGINCDSVKNAPYCATKPPERVIKPDCTLAHFNYSVLTRTGYQPAESLLFTPSDFADSSNLTVHLSWSVMATKSRTGRPVLFHNVKWGLGIDVSEKMQFVPQIQGILIPSVLFEDDAYSQFVACKGDNKTTKLACEATLNNLEAGVKYVMKVCAVYDIRAPFRDYDLTSLGSFGFNLTGHGFEVQLMTEMPKGSTARLALMIGILLGVPVILLVTAGALLLKRQQNQKKQLELMRIEHAKLRENPYSEQPKKSDIWELDRRKLVIYDDQKLGSGAFGSVYKGRLVGKLLTHKDSQSSLATNLMRLENCTVAVKMLPEYADDISKGDFRKEINLMKQLGYHERLVNMLACVTDSEPYCLVVEYCSDGDLLHFLRDRCKYMVKLDELGINYVDPSPEDDVDFSMVPTLKTLLSFSVQISYGLEYLSQKGFIHRDVAARNVLVHEGIYAKIGDFGLCRFVYGNSSAYWGKGGRLPIKWMAPEAIKSYEFSAKSDVWSFGVLMFEIITLGGSPYPGVQPADVEAHLDAGNRIDQPDNCSDALYKIMLDCWKNIPEERLTFLECQKRLASMLEEVTEDYSYLKLNQERDYYNVPYGDMPEGSTPPNESAKLAGSKIGTIQEDMEANFEEIELDANFENSFNSDAEKTRNRTRNRDSGLEDSISCGSKNEEILDCPVSRQQDQKETPNLSVAEQREFDTQVCGSVAKQREYDRKIDHSVAEQREGDETMEHSVAGQRDSVASDLIQVTPLDTRGRQFSFSKTIPEAKSTNADYDSSQSASSNIAYTNPAYTNFSKPSISETGNWGV